MLPTVKYDKELDKDANTETSLIQNCIQTSNINPNITSQAIHPAFNPEMIKYGQQLESQRQQNVFKSHEDSYPIKYVVVHSIVIILLSLIVYLIQIIRYRSSGEIKLNYFLEVLIASYFILTVTLSLIISKNFNL